MVPMAGVEPARLTALPPQYCVSTHSINLILKEKQVFSWRTFFCKNQHKFTNKLRVYFTPLLVNPATPVKRREP